MVSSNQYQYGGIAVLAFSIRKCHISFSSLLFWPYWHCLVVLPSSRIYQLNSRQRHLQWLWWIKHSTHHPWDSTLAQICVSLQPSEEYLHDKPTGSLFYTTLECFSCPLGLQLSFSRGATGPCSSFLKPAICFTYNVSNTQAPGGTRVCRRRHLMLPPLLSWHHRGPRIKSALHCCWNIKRHIWKRKARKVWVALVSQTWNKLGPVLKFEVWRSSRPRLRFPLVLQVAFAQKRQNVSLLFQTSAQISGSLFNLPPGIVASKSGIAKTQLNSLDTAHFIRLGIIKIISAIKS